MSATCLLSGAESVTICDIDSGRIEFAIEQKFATVGICTAGRAGDAKDLAFILKEEGAINGRGFDRSFDCTGAEMCIQAAILGTVPGGKHFRMLTSFSFRLVKAK